MQKEKIFSSVLKESLQRLETDNISECKRSVNFYEINLASKKNDTDVEIQLARLQPILFCHKMSQYFGLVLSVN